MYSRPILEAFEEETGIEVKAVYDTEAAKTTGLVNRLIAERQRPRADVFWNNEVAQTIVLKDKDVLQPYPSPEAADIPQQYKDIDGYWYGLAARARVIIYNTDRVDDPPTSFMALLDPQWRGEAAIAKPLFGTTATHAAALFALWGPDPAKGCFQDLKANNIAVLAGNATVRDMVAQGEYAWGLTDTDDANGAVEDGLPAKWLLPDQGEDEMGTLLIPNTVALIKDAPNPIGGKALIDYLLSPDVEAALADARSIQIPLDPDIEGPAELPEADAIKTLDVAYDEIAAWMPQSAEFIQEEFLD
jgi:iron(III) transport system substrate-binding protein